MTGGTTPPLRVEVPRETDAVDLAEFVAELGLSVSRRGTIVEIAEQPAAIGSAVTSWLAARDVPLVPAGQSKETLMLRPPAD
jgi:hypothetical protein